MDSKIVSARALGVAGCHTCGQAVHIGKQTHVECSRCGADVHYRKHDSIKRAWAFLIAAFVMYIPANTEPMMRTTSLGNVSADTIMEGVIYFLSHGDYLIGVVIFAASIMLPLLKMIALAYIFTMAQSRSTERRMEQTNLYKLAEMLGKWSMLDIFVVGLMAGLVQLGTLTTISPGPACIAFAAVVILTMISEMVFDPKLIWDKKEGK
ncbi:MAG: paraquat-inducible membrane protein A [Xanthomonadales bacterium]|nr:paraquat-inducible membrane protein A [Xanthomonadales bacterium]